MPCIGQCGIYEGRPTYCKDFPTPHSMLPASCTYTFTGDERKGECRPEICLEDNCCAVPRERGDPLAKALDQHAGGKPCRHLEWVEESDVEKCAENVGIQSDITAAVLAEVLSDVHRT